MTARSLPPADGDAFRRIAEGRHHDPHSLLGPHDGTESIDFLTFLPDTREAALVGGPPLQRLPGTDFFWCSAPRGSLPPHPTITWRQSDDCLRQRIDPYSFGPSVAAADLALFASGGHTEGWKLLGAHPATFDGVEGVRFAVWAPNAGRVSVVGPFCHWDGRCLPMRVIGSSGVWELFIPGLATGELYKFEIRNRATGEVALKSDPYGRATELRPATASIVCGGDDYRWGDSAWMTARRQHDWLHAPLSIYEVHLGSWERDAQGRFLSYDDLADRLIPYVQRLGFTHIELLPVTEHPLDDSWGYQTTGYFAPTRRFGSPDGLRRFIDRCHQADIGVLLDWVPAHFPRDAHGLARFDGTPLYEHADPRRGEHLDWGTYIFDYGRNEVRSFLLSSACYWLEAFHFDGLRVDAVASMLYLDFGRRGDYLPNRLGGRENLEAVDFLRQLNAVTHARAPGTVMMAEESTDWPMVSRPTDTGGLGFSMKWNMGWMHDTLSYFKENPLYRSHHQDKLTFVMMYAYSENFILPLSHDEVVHLKRSLLGRMPGDRWQQMANLRLLFTYMWTLPGKKLLFMGGEFAQPWEWNFGAALPWHLLDHAEHRGMQQLVGDLNALYVSLPALHRHEFEPEGFRWIDCDDRQHSTLSFLRLAGDSFAVVVLNFTPVPREDHRIGVPRGGDYEIVFNSDSAHYGGANLGNPVVASEAVAAHGQAWSVVLQLPPLAGLILKPA